MNRLLEVLSAENRNRILALARHVPLPVRTPLHGADEPAAFVYFLTSGVASVVIELVNGGSAEVALVGSEGMTASLDLLGPALTPARCFIQMEATAYRLPMAEMKKIFLDSEEVRSRMLELVQQQSMSMSQLAACNKLHESEPRLARWLLMVQDRVQSDELSLTQEFLAQMLGTQRTTVVMVAGAFQRSGIITYSRGKVTILSRERLISAACDCYGVAHRLYSNLYRT
ncbi:MAG: Crp/Fnr family transcriptional regulator [Janthinobacterium lividum]